MRQDAQSIGNRIGNIMELEIEEHLLALVLKVFDHLVSHAVKKLHANLVESHTVAQSFDKVMNLIHGMNIQSYNQSFICHFLSLPLSPIVL